MTEEEGNKMEKDILFQIDMQLYDEFNDKLCEMNDNLGTIYTYKDIMDLEEAEKATGKQTNALALILLADEIISKSIFHDDPLTKEQVSKYFSKDIDEAERIYNLILDSFYRNINKFEESTTGELWGTYDVDEGNNVTSFYFIPSVLKEILNQNNINFDGVKSKLLKSDYIVRDSAKKYAIQKRIRNKNIRCIKFIIKESDFIEKLKMEDDMPF